MSLKNKTLNVMETQTSSELSSAAFHNRYGVTQSAYLTEQP